jgi:hypothetical protein
MTAITSIVIQFLFLNVTHSRSLTRLQCSLRVLLAHELADQWRQQSYWLFVSSSRFFRAFDRSKVEVRVVDKAHMYS